MKAEPKPAAAGPAAARKPARRRTVPLKRARTRLYYIWGACVILTIALFQLSVAIRGDYTISRSLATESMLKVLALFVPVAAAFGAFWWRKGAREVRGSLSIDRWRVALLTNLAYLAVVLGLCAYALLLQDYDSGRTSLRQWVGDIMQLGMVLSPIATAPCAFLLGVEKIDVKVSNGTGDSDGGE